MKYTYRSTSTSPIGCLVIAAFYVIVIALMAFWTQHSIDFWLDFAGKPEKSCPFWAAFLVSIFGPFTLGANVVTLVFSLFI